MFRVDTAETAAQLASAFGQRDRNGVASDADAAVDRAASTSGQPLPGDLRDRFESSLGADLSSVRLHTGCESAQAADSVGAKAYTAGQDIHFGAGHYDPSSAFGVHLIAHEVAHTVQQAGGAPAPQYKLDVSTPGDAAEVEADRAADAMIAGSPFAVDAAAGGVARKNTTTTPTKIEPIGPGTFAPDADEEHKDAEGNVIKKSPSGHWYLAEEPASIKFPHTAGKYKLYPINPNQSYVGLRGQVVALLAKQLAQAKALKGDMKYWFAKVYYFVSVEELKAIDAGAYQYPHMKMQEVIAFQAAYGQNLENWKAGNKAKVEDHWKKAFEKAEDSKWDWLWPKAEEIFFALLPSMQAHIRFDLPRAIAACYATHYAGIPGTSLTDFRGDFDAMLPVFAAAQASIVPEIKAESVGGADPGTWASVQGLSPFDVKKERNDAWEKTELVAKGLEQGKSNAAINGNLTGTFEGKHPGNGASSFEVGGDSVEGFDWTKQPGMKQDAAAPPPVYGVAPPTPPFPELLYFQYARPLDTDAKLELTIRADQDLAPYKALAQWTRLVRDAEISIEGHASAEGTDLNNQVLGERRSTLVQSFLVLTGADNLHNKVSPWSSGEDGSTPKPEFRYARITVVKPGTSKKQHNAINGNLPSEVPAVSKPTGSGS